MADLRMEQIASQRMQQEQRQILRMEQADLLEISGVDFYKLIAELERSPLFHKLYQHDRLIRYQRFPRTDVARSFYELKDELVAGGSGADVESLLQDRSQVVSLVQKLGEDRFKQYFLFPESGIAPEEIAAACQLSVAEVNKINEFINDFSVVSEFFHPSSLGSGVVHYSRIASVDRGGGGWVISYFSPLFARGVYSVDYQRFEGLKADGTLTESEAKEARQLFKKLELINSRKNTISQILQKVVDHQALYLESGKTQSLLPFSQKELAKKLGLAPSSVSRAIRGKSIDTPWREEVALKQFFPRPRRFKKDLLKKLMEGEEGLTSDEAIREHMQTKFGVSVSRRSVANMRHELNIPAGRGKRHPAITKESK